MRRRRLGILILVTPFSQYLYPHSLFHRCAMKETSFEIAIDMYKVFEVACFTEIDSP